MAERGLGVETWNYTIACATQLRNFGASGADKGNLWTCVSRSLQQCSQGFTETAIIWCDSHRDFALLPLINGLTEPLALLLTNNGIRAMSRIFPLGQEHRLVCKQVLFMRFPVQTFRRTIWEKLEGVHKPEETDILETQQPWEGSNIVTHALLNNHSIDFNNAHGINKGNFRARKHWNIGILQSQVNQ